MAEMLDRARKWLNFNRMYFRRTPPPWDTNITPPELRRFVETTPAAAAPRAALDLGCGTGTNAVFLAMAGWRVTGVDFVPRAIASARRKARAAHVRVNFRVGDVSALADLTGPFDLILDIGCFHALTQPNKLAYARNVQRWLAPGGTFLLYVHFSSSRPCGSTRASESDLLLFGPQLALVERVDSIDSARNRPSAWLTYRRAG